MRTWAGLAVLCLAIGGLLKWPEVVTTPGSDTGMFATYGLMLLQGARPYVDFWDLHPPLTFLYWLCVQAVTGGEWPATGLLAHALDLVLSVLTALLVAGIVRRCGGSPRAAILSAVLVVGFADQVMLSQEGSNPSKLTLLPSTLAIWLYFVSLERDGGRRLALAAGAACAVAGLAKQPALLTLVALASHAGFRRDRGRLLSLVLGSAVALAGACGILAVIGSLDGFIAQAWIYNFERTLTGYFLQPVKPPVINLGRVMLESAGALVVLAALGGVLLARAPESTQRLLVWWSVVNLIAVTAFREFVYVVPGLAAVSGLGIQRLWSWPEFQRVGRGAIVILTVAALLLTTSFERVQLARARFERGSGVPTPTEQVGLQLRGDAFPAGPMFVYGNGAQMYALSGRLPATPYVNAEALRATAPDVEKARADVVNRLRSNLPPVIVLAPHVDEPELNLSDFPAMRALLHDRYTVESQHSSDWAILVKLETSH